MNKIIVLRGLHGCGKTTYAKELLEKEPGRYKRVNKDDLRAMLDSKRRSKSNERMVCDVRDSIVDMTLAEHKDVIVDDTNLEWKHVERMYELSDLHDAEVEVVDMDTDIETCIENDLKRPNSVGSTIIRSMFYKHYAGKEPDYDGTLEDAIICDIDGTLAHTEARSPYDWDKVESDTVDTKIEYILASNRNATRIVLLSGRDGSCRKLTEKWLKGNDIKYDALLMREARDNRKDCVVKHELYNEHILGKYNVKFVLDDRQQVVDMWRGLGLTCYQVAPGMF